MPTPSKSGIVTDASGQRHIPESVRADGSTRKAIRVRPGYRPPEDVEVYKNRTAENFRMRGTGPPPGSEGLRDDNGGSGSGSSKTFGSASAAKNAKRREARKKAKDAAVTATATEGEKEVKEVKDVKEGILIDLSDTPELPPALRPPQQQQQQPQPQPESPKDDDPVAEREKHIRALKKKLKQARDLEAKSQAGQTLLPEQAAKVDRIGDLVSVLEGLGIREAT